ncbi:repeat organellar [Cryptosporidium bovis]|uniref:repeat organellar n=1 Tax=Cryptosporidium bovis TaxID=310047 RepID=UPI00351A370D|nr:repeat organellar [Cryptosporidium bovis]
MRFHNEGKMLKSKVLEENLSLFIENKELSDKICEKEVENVQLLGRISDHEENKKSLEKFISKIREDEVDLYLDSVYTKKRLESSEKVAKSLRKYIDYLKDVIEKCITFSDSINKLINNKYKCGDTFLLGNSYLSTHSEEFFREALQNYFKMNNLIYEDLKEELKYRNRYKEQKKENAYLKSKIEDLTEIKILDVTKGEVSLNINKKGGKSKLSISKKNMLEITNMDCKLGNNGVIEGLCGYCNNKKASFSNDDLEKEYLLYSVKQFRKENYTLKQKIFEYEFDSSRVEEVKELELKLEEKQTEIENLEKEYSLWVLNLQEENSELRIIINDQEKKEMKLIENMNNEKEKTKQEYKQFNEELINEYETKLSEKITELNKIRNENMYDNKKNIELEIIRKNLNHSEENLRKFSEENQNLNVKLKKLMKEYEKCEEELHNAEKVIKNANDTISNLKETQIKLNDQLNNEKTLHDKFEQEACTLKKELDNFLSDMYKGGTQKKSRGKIIGEAIESERLGSVEIIIGHCKELENKVEELTTQLENIKYGNETMFGAPGGKCSKLTNNLSSGHANNISNNAEIETLFDQVQNLKKEREQLKKDIRQRDWARVETEMLQKKTLEEVDQLKRDNARLMLENLRLRDLTGNRNSIQIKSTVYNSNQSDENTQSNSSRSSLNKAVQGEHVKESGVEFNQSECDRKTENSIQSMLNLKPPKRHSLLLFGQKSNRDSIN